MKRIFDYSREELSWILYDVANSAFVLIMITTMMPIFYKEFAAAKMAPETSTATWGYANSFASLVMAFLSPILGTFADYPKRKKMFFLFFWGLGLAATFSLLFSNSGDWFLVLALFAIARIGYAGSDLFYNSFLTDVTEPKRFDMISSAGYAWGYIGSTIPFFGFIALVLYMPQSQYSIGKAAAMATIALVGLWWMFFSFPMIFKVKQKYALPPSQKPLTEGFLRLKNVVIEIYQNKKLLYFLIAYFFYIDGVDTTITMAVAYGQDVNVSTVTLVAAILFIQVVAFPFALLFGRLAKLKGAKSMIFVGVGVYMVIATLGYFLPDIQNQSTKEVTFWFLAFLVATSMGGVQALSRSLFAANIPKEKSSEYFGFYNIFGRFSLFLGPALMGGFGSMFGHSRYGILSLIILFILGGYFLYKAGDMRAPEN